MDRDPDKDKDELKASDPIAESSGRTRDPDDDKMGRGDDTADARAERLRVNRSASHTTDTTVLSRLSSSRSQRRPKKAWYKTPNPLRWRAVPPLPDRRAISAEYGAGWWSRLTFSWMGSLMRVGYARQLEHKDLWMVNPDRGADVLTARTKKAFGRRVEKGDRYPLLWSIHEAFLVEFWVGGASSLAMTLLQVTAPFTLRFLIRFATDAYRATRSGAQSPPIGHGVGLVIGITAMQVLQSLAVNHFVYRGMMIGGQVRAVLISLIFEKTMVISGRARAGGLDPGLQGDADESAKGDHKNTIGDGSGWSNGKVVSMMSVDTYRIDQASALFHMMWTAPIACLLTLVLLIINLRESALAGFALLVLGVPALTRAIQSLLHRRGKINKLTDQRVSLTQEILQSVRFVKFFGWEMAFLDRLKQIRRRELSSIQILLSIRNAINALSMSLPIFASLLAFVTYSLTSNVLEPAEVFSSLALFNGLRLPLNLLPMVIGQATDAWKSLSRIQAFLLAEEQEEQASFRDDDDEKSQSAVEMRHASYTWERTTTHESEEPDLSRKDKALARRAAKAQTPPAPDASAANASASTLVEREPFRLQDLSLAMGKKELVAVIGAVGSGKSSLLSAIAGDMRRTSGQCIFPLGAQRAFCTQNAWILNASVRDNVLFGKDLDRDWYQDVIRACALGPDIEMLPYGDATEVGERGITISGGQKQRLNIARAIYYDADIVILDDPLSAVDAHVGRHIFDEAILGLLRDKCRILATHQLWVLNRCDRVIWMDDGKVGAIGTFEELMSNYVGFRNLMETTAVERKGGGEEEEDGGGEGEGEGDGEMQEEVQEAVPEDVDEKGDAGKSKKMKKQQGLMQAEERAVASVPWSVYAAYIRASGSSFNAVTIVLTVILFQASNILTTLWLSWWTSDKFAYSQSVYMGVYAGLGAAQSLLVFLFSTILTICCTRAGKTLLRQAMTRTLRAPMSFFDTTPLGRITNRFSRDVDVVDNTLSDSWRMYILTVVNLVGIFALIIAFYYWFALALFPLFFVFLMAASYYRSSAREVKRFESVLRSVVFAKFTEGLSGVATIRAYGLKGRFVADLHKAIDEMNAAYYLTFSNQRWLSLRLDTVGNLLVFTTGILVVTSRLAVDPSIAGLVLSYILGIVQVLQFSVRQLAEVENGMNAVERLLHYGTKLEEEAPEHTIPVRPSWPEKGAIVFDRVQLRYRAGLPLVLKDLTMHVRGGERIGIVGRTGAGKSSIMSTLFRLVELSGGQITIDGVNISTIGLHDLRSRLAIIPQDPTLFRGTIRSNLDPFNEHTDLELWSALRQADLVPPEAGSDDDGSDRDKDGEQKQKQQQQQQQQQQQTAGAIRLDQKVEEDGLNFSLGQRQLMALARALVRGSRIIVCDEATSSVDMGTDDKIQATMARAFRGRTLLCIAHRLRTIVGCDRVCVLHAGRIAELDSPLALWTRAGGIFRGMCDRSGIRVEDIRRAAAEAEDLAAEVVVTRT